MVASFSIDKNPDIEQANPLPVEIQSVRTIFVSANGGFDFTSIQQALDNATAGDTIFVYNGTYFENVTISKGINLVGENPANTIMRINPVANIIKVIANNVQISGFTIDNSSDTGIRVINSSNVTISGSRIINNYKNGIIFGGTTYSTIANNYFENNFYGTIYINMGSDHNTITGNTIRGPTMYGIVSDHSSYQYMAGNNILNSKKPNLSYNSYGIYAYYSNGSIIIGNNATNNTVGLQLVRSFDNEVRDLRALTNNYYGISLTYGSARNIISGNYMAGNNYGLEIFEHISSNVFEGNILENNIYRGVEAQVNIDYNRFSNNIFTNNHGFYFGGGNGNIFENNVFLNDGFYFESADNSTLANNTVNGLPIVYLEGAVGTVIDTNAAQVFAFNSRGLTVKNMHFGNVPVGVQLVNVNDSIIQNSTFDGTGNAIYLSEVLGSHIIGNSIRNPGTGIILYSSSLYHFSSN